MIKLFKISGDSLYPIYKNKDIVLSLSFKITKLKINDIVVFKHEDYGLMIKKIQKISLKNNQKYYYLIGTNASSIDSRNFGYISQNNITHKVLFKIF